VRLAHFLLHLGYEALAGLPGLAISFVPAQTPLPMPARKAAPSAVVSTIRGRSMGGPEQVGLELHEEVVRRAPPSTRNMGIGLPMSCAIDWASS
jgi:hypothetical protein